MKIVSFGFTSDRVSVQPKEAPTAMKTNHFWIEIVTLCTAIACGLALLLASLGAAAGAAVGASDSGQATEPSAALQQSAPQQTYEGMVTCSRCGAKHSAKIGKTASDCAQVCVHGGAKFALVDGDKTYLLDGDLALLKKLAGQRTRIVGSMSGNTITVASIASGT